MGLDFCTLVAPGLLHPLLQAEQQLLRAGASKPCPLMEESTCPVFVDGDFPYGWVQAVYFSTPKHLPVSKQQQQRKTR